jgi:predicted N-formylglutamate amidohydrolase
MAQPAPVETPTGLLGPTDPAPVEFARLEGQVRAILICDHASNAIPVALDELGLGPDILEDHIGWDIGAAALARRLSDRFVAPLVLSGFSRLVIDCNRQLDDPSSIVLSSDGNAIPGNLDLQAVEAARRAEACFHPYHDAIEKLIDRKMAEGRDPVVLSIHSFTPVFGGFERPWHIGVLWNQDGRLALPFMDALDRYEDVVVGDNQPYSARENFGYSIEAHGENRNLPHLLIEVRQDLIQSESGLDHWAGIVGDGIDHALETLRWQL